MSSKSGRSGSEGRMRISWVILQRRLPRRSVLDGREGTGSFAFIICSNEEAIPFHLSQNTCSVGNRILSRATKPIEKTYWRITWPTGSDGSTKVLDRQSGHRKTEGCDIRGDLLEAFVPSSSGICLCKGNPCLSVSGI